MKIIYLSGPMSGLPNLNFDEFHKIAAEIRTRGFEIINPAEIEQPDKSWNPCMRRDIVELMRADTIALLKGWKNSAGARLEITIAEALGMKIVDAYTLEPIEVEIKVSIHEQEEAVIAQEGG